MTSQRYQAVLIFLAVQLYLYGTLGQDLTCSPTPEKDTAGVHLPFDILTNGEFEDGTYPTTSLFDSPKASSGIVGYALYLDGVTAVSIGERPDTCFFNPDFCTQGYTLAFWLNQQAFKGRNQVYIMSNSGETEMFGVFVVIEADDRGLVIGLSSTTSGAVLSDASWAGEAKDAEWHHLVITADFASNLELFEDGVLTAQAAFAPRAFVDTGFNQFRLGGATFDDRPRLRSKCFIDEVLFWDETKDATFIQSLHRSYIDGSSSDCVSPYRCVEELCTCPSGHVGISCDAKISFTADIDDTENVPENTEVQFRCSVQADPIPPYGIWSRVGYTDSLVQSQTDTDQNELDFKVTLVRKQPKITYFCKMTSPKSAYFVDSQSFTYSVEYEPDAVIFVSDLIPTVARQEGTSVELSCSVDAYPLPSLSIWLLNKEGEETLVKEQISSDTKLSVAMLLKREHDQAMFFCKADGGKYTKISEDSYTYSIEYLPQSISIQSSIPSDVPIKEGDSVVITCTTDANPVQKMTLSINDFGILATDSEETNTLVKQHVMDRLFDGAQFQCEVALKKIGLITSDVLIFSVLYSPIVVRFSSDAIIGNPIKENTVIIFMCETRANPLPTLVVMSQTPGQSEQPINDQFFRGESVAVSFRITRDYHRAAFFCRATGEDPSYILDSINTFVFDVTYDGRDLEISGDVSVDVPQPEGAQVTISCTATGNPVPTLHLIEAKVTNIGTRLTQTVTLTRSLFSFQCYAEYDDSEQTSSTLRYDVTYLPDTVRFIASRSTSMVAEDTIVSFTCSVVANPAPLLTIWFSDGSTEEMVSDQSLTGLELIQTIPLTRKYNGGMFFCKALGSDPSYELHSIGIPCSISYAATTVDISTSPLPTNPQPEDAVVHITCSADANPPPLLAVYYLDPLDAGAEIIVSQQTIAATSFQSVLTLRQDHDGKQIFCRDQQRAIDSQSVVFQVSYIAPSVTLSASQEDNVPLAEDTEVEFICSADGRPAPQLSLWSRDIDDLEEHPIGEEVTTETVLITRVTLSRVYHDKEIFCKAVDENLQYTKYSNSQRYSLIYDPADVVLEADIPSGETVAEGTLIHLTCSVDANPPPTLSLHYILDGQVTLLSQADNPSLHMTVPQVIKRAFHQVAFFCTATGDSDSYVLNSEQIQYNVQYRDTELLITTDYATTDPVMEHTEVEFTCTIDAYPLPGISLWLRDGSSIVELSQQHQTTLIFKMKITLNRYHHGKPFYCQATGSDQSEYTAYSASVVFSVLYEPAEVSISTDLPDNNLYPEDTPVTFTCLAEGNPSPLLSLHLLQLDEEVLQISSQDSPDNSFMTSVILKRTFNQAHFYCSASEASHGYTIQSQRKQFSISYIPDVLLSSDPDTLEVTENTEVEFACLADGFPHPVLTLWWSTDGETEEQVSQQAVQGTSLTVSFNIRRQHHQASFVCRADAADQSYRLDSNSITYSVQYIPDVVTITSSPSSDISQPAGSTVYIVCHADSQPLPQLSLWIQTDQGGNLLNVQSDLGSSFGTYVTLESADDGQGFFCNAKGSHPYDIDSEQIRFDVTYRAPDVTLEFSLDPDTIQDENTLVLLTCKVDGNPTPQLSIWTRDTSGFEEQATNDIVTDLELSVNIVLTRRHHGKQFYCKAANTDQQYTVYSNPVVYNIKYPVEDIELLSDTPTTEAVQPNTNIRFTCKADSNPAPLLTLWKRSTAGKVRVATTIDRSSSTSFVVSLATGSTREIFFCTAKWDNTWLTIESNHLTYRVEYIPAEIIISSSLPSTDPVPEDTVIQFTCQAESAPDPELSLWSGDVTNTANELSQQRVIAEQLVTSVTLRRRHHNQAFFCKATGNQPTPYILYSTPLVFDIVYAAIEVLIETDIPPELSLSENTEVTFTCKADANPAPQMSLWSSASPEGNTRLSVQESPHTTLSTVSVLTKSMDGQRFYCVAEGIDPLYRVESTSIAYKIHYIPEEVHLVSDLPDGSSAVEGTEIQITCSLEASPPPELSLWRTDGSNTQQLSPQSVVGLTATINIVLTREHAESLYFCKATGGNDEYVLHSTSISFDVLYEPTEVIMQTTPPAESLQPLGGIIEITCSTNGNPPPILSVMMHDGIEESQIATQTEAALDFKTFIIMSQQYNLKRIFCRATGDGYVKDSNDAVTYQLTENIAAPTGIQLELLPDTDEFLDEKTQIEINCVVIGGTSNPQLSVWSYGTDNQEETTGDTRVGQTLTVYKLVERSDNGRIFFCKATDQNMQYTLMSNKKQILIRYDPDTVEISTDIPSASSFVRAGTVISVSCQAEANPAPILSLWKQSQDTEAIEVNKATEPSLQLTTQMTVTKEEDELQLFCRATGNTYTKDSTHLQLYIHYEPDIVEISTDIPPDSTFVLEGTGVRISCQTEANPYPILSLWKQALGTEAVLVGQATTAALDFSLTFTLIKEDDQTQYFCRAVEGNNYVKDSTMVEFNIEYLLSMVTLVSSLPSGQRLVEGTDVQLNCSSDGKSVLSIWTDNGEDVSEFATGNGTYLSVILSFTQSLNDAKIFCKAVGLYAHNVVISDESFRFYLLVHDPVITMTVLPSSIVSVGTLLNISCVVDEITESLISWTVGSEKRVANSQGLDTDNNRLSMIWMNADISMNNTLVRCSMGDSEDSAMIRIMNTESLAELQGSPDDINDISQETTTNGFNKLYLLAIPAFAVVLLSSVAVGCAIYNWSKPKPPVDTRSFTHVGSVVFPASRRSSSLPIHMSQMKPGSYMW